MACLTLVGWEKLQMPGSFQTEQGCAWNSGYMVAPFAAATHLLRIKTVCLVFFLIAMKMRYINMKATIPVRIKCLYFSPWKCQGSWPARSAAALERLPLAHRCPGCLSALCKIEKIEAITFVFMQKIPAQFCCPALTCALWTLGWDYGLTGRPDSHLDNPRGR